MSFRSKEEVNAVCMVGDRRPKVCVLGKVDVIEEEEVTMRKK